QLVGIIDWEDAALGDPLADVANSRLEILCAFGIEAIQSFTHHSQSLTTVDFTNLPSWDLCAALRPISQIAQWGLDETTEKLMRERHRWFVAKAFEKLAGLKHTVQELDLEFCGNSNARPSLMP